MADFFREKNFGKINSLMYFESVFIKSNNYQYL